MGETTEQGLFIKILKARLARIKKMDAWDVKMEFGVKSKADAIKNLERKIKLAEM